MAETKPTPDAKHNKAKAYDIAADMQPDPFAVNPDEILNTLYDKITDEHGKVQRREITHLADNNTILSDILERLILNAGFCAQQKMEMHMAGDARFPNEEIKSLISLVKLVTMDESSYGTNGHFGCKSNPTINKLAKKLYKKSLKLNPNNNNATEMLKKLKKK